MGNLRNLFTHNGVLTTAKLNEYGISAYMINKLLKENRISRISRGNYIYNELHLYYYEIISVLLPESIIYLESALLLHEYTDRIPNEWKIAVGRNMDRNKYNIEYPKIKAHFVEESILGIGVMKIETFLGEDNNKNLNNLYKYARELNMLGIVETYIGVWF